jgi:hypothetical protein
MKKFFRFLLAGGILLMTIPSLARSQEKIKVLSDGPLRPALIQIGEAFRRDKGRDVESLGVIFPAACCAWDSPSL